jgi:hypothetical protein
LLSIYQNDITFLGGRTADTTELRKNSVPIRVPMVPEGLKRAAMTPDTGSACPSYGVDAAPMLYQQHYAASML